MLISRMFAYQASQLLWAASTCGGSLTNPDALSVKRYEVVCNRCCVCIHAAPGTRTPAPGIWQVLSMAAAFGNKWH